MKKFFTLLIITTMLLLLSGNNLKAQLCTTGQYSTGCSDGDQMTDFSFATIVQTGMSCTSSDAYDDYSATISTSLTPGNTYPISGTMISTWSEGVKVWIDYNNDNTFDDATELIYATPSTVLSFSSTVTIPVTATPGTHRMRCRTVYGSTTFSACGVQSYGNTEDYTVNIAALASPYFTIAPGAYNYNYVAMGNQSAYHQFDITGNNLTGAPGNITVNAPAGFVVSLTSGGTYQGSVTIPYSGSTLASTPVYAKFVPLAPNTLYSANMVIAGGGTSSNILLSGTSQLIYCNSAATYVNDEEVVRVALGSMDNAAPCSTLAPGPGSAASLYSNYTGSVTPPNLIATLTYPLTVEVALCNTSFYNNMVGVWIDFNQNGIWDSTLYNGVWYSENVFKSATYTYGPQTVNANITIPVNAVAGLTRMRVISIETTSATSVVPCGTYGYGETEDYTVNIIPAVPCVTPTSQPTAFVFSPNYLFINGSFTASPDADHYMIVRSTSATLTAMPVDGTVYAAGASLGGGTVVSYQTYTNFTDNNLNYATQYYYHVFAINANCIGGPFYLTVNPLTQSVNTLTPATIHSVATGFWEDPATWSTGTLPDAFATVYIDSLYTVHLSANLDSCFNLIVNHGGTLDASGNGGVLNLQNGITNNGTINVASDTNVHATFKFWGNYSATYNGTGINNVYQLSLNKTFTGHVTATSPTLEISLANLTVNNVSTDTTGFIPATFNGVYKFSGTFNLANRLFSSAAYTIPASGGIWMNNPNFTVVGQEADANMTGFLNVTQGTFNIGKAINNTMFLNAASLFYMDGGAINSTGRIYNSTAGTFKMTNGTITVGTIGNTNGTGEFEYGLTTPVAFSMTGGSIVVQNANTGANPIDVRFPSPGITNVTITGGTVQLGNTLTQNTAQSFCIDGVFYDVNVDVTTAQHGTRMYAATDIKHNFTNSGTGVFNVGNGISGATLRLYGNLTNNGVFNGLSSTSSALQLLGTTAQTLVLGAGSQIANLTLNNAAGANVGSLIINYGLTLTNGALSTSGTFTFGDATANTFNLTKSHGTLSGTIGFNFANMTAVNYTYNDTVAQTTGTEIPSIINGTLTVNNVKGLTIGKKLATGSLTMTNGMLNTTTTNILTVTNTAASAISGSFSSTRFVNGPLARAFPAGGATVGSWTFPIGTMGVDTSYNPYTIINPTTGVNIPYVKAYVTKGTYTGTPGTYMLSVNTDRRWNVTVDSGNFTFARIQLTDTSANNKLIGKCATINGTFVGMQCSQSGFNVMSNDSTITLANYFALGTKNPMSFISCTSTQTNTALVSPGTTNQQIIGLQVVTLGNANPLVLSQINFNTNGTTNTVNDISNIKLFSTGINSAFATTTVIDSTVTFAGGTFNLNPSGLVPFYLSEGTNYLWLTYDIKPSATNNDVVDAQCISITVDGIPRTPTISSPVGNRTVFINPIQLLLSENFDATWVSAEDLVPAWACPQTGYQRWHNDTYAGVDWPSSGGSNPATGALSTPHYARFHAYWASSGTTGDMISPTFSCAVAGSKKLDFYYYKANASSSTSGPINVYISTDNGTTWSPSLFSVSGPVTAWTKYTVNLGNITSTTVKLKFTATSDYYADMCLDQVSVYVYNGPNMKFLSSTSTQSVFSPVIASTKDQQILSLKVVTQYDANPLPANSFTLNTNGSTNALADIDSAKIYFTGTSNTFATTNLFGSFVNPNGTFTINGNQLLTGTSTQNADTNYFWLVYNIKSSPISFDSVDAEFNLLNLGGVPYSPVLQAPVGNRVVRAYLGGIYTIDNTLPNAGTNYSTFANAVNDLNLVGINAPVTFNVKAGQSWSTTVLNGTSPNNFAYKITATGTAANPIIFQRSGTGANPVLNITGTSTASATTGDKGIWLNGCDYITFNGIDITDAGTTSSNFLDYGFYFNGASITNGCISNTVMNSTITLHRNSLYAYGVYVDGSVNSSGTGPNKYNKFYNNTIKYAVMGYKFNGYTSTLGYRDIGNEVGTIAGGRSLIMALGQSGNTTPACGIYSYYQDSIKVFNTMIDTVQTSYTTYPVACGIYGYYNNYANFYNDSIRKITQYGAGDAVGINFENQYGVNNIYNNYISEVVCAGSSGNMNAMRLYSYNSVTPYIYAFNVYNNEIRNCSGKGAIEGLYAGSLSGTGMITNIYNNKVYGLNSTSISSSTNSTEGILVSGSSIFNVYNNMVSDLTMPYSTSAPSVKGITAQSTSATRIFNNTVYLDSTNTQVAAYQTAAMHASGPNPLDMRNNIFVNRNTMTTGTRAVAFWYGSTSYTSISSDNNLYYSGTPSAKNLIFWDGTNRDSTLISYQGRMITRDQQATTGFVPFLNRTVKPFNLHIDPTISSSVESHGQRITTPIAITNDIDGDIRFGEAGYTGSGVLPDLGADELNGITEDNLPPILTFTALGNSTLLTGVNFNNVVITDPLTGVNTITAKPRVYFKKPSMSNDLSGWKYAEPLNSTSPFNFYLDYSLLGVAVNPTDTIQYFIVAQDKASTPNFAKTANISGVLSSTTLDITNFPITGGNMFKIAYPINGVYNVGTGNQYVALTTDSVSGFFRFLNSNVLTGNVTVNITSNLVETGAITLNALPSEGAGNYTITIQPSDASLKIISSSYSGSLIRNNGASNVIFNGSYNGTGRYLKLLNNSTSGGGFLFSTGANNCSVKNTIVRGSSISGGYGFNITGGSVNNLNIDNNLIEYLQYGIYESGSTTLINSNLTISNNILGTDTATTSLGYGGINLTGYCNGVNISNNTVKNIMNSTATAPYGMYLSTSVKNVNIIGNIIRDIDYTGTGGWGGFGIILNTADNASNINIINNVINHIYGDGWYGWSTTDEIVGIHIYGTMGGVKLYNNSINMYGSNQGYNTATTNAAIYVSATATNIDIRNNIIKNAIYNPANSSGKSYGIYCAAAASAFTNIDYNIYYTSGTQGILGYLGADINSIANWRTATLQDVHSKFVDPIYTSNTNLLPSKCPTSPAITAAAPLAAVPTDILNITRSIQPTIGAYELGYAKTLNISAFMQEYYAGHGLPMNQTLDMDMNTGDMFPKYLAPVVDLVQVLIYKTDAPDFTLEYQYDDYNLNQDGTITPEISLPSDMTGSRYIVINHRNSIETWSDSIDFTCLAVNYNFYTHPISVQFPSNMFVDSLNNIYYGSLIWGGDVGFDLANPSRDGIINIFDLSSVFDAINDPSGMYSAGYIAQDLNGDGVVNIYDLSLVFDNLNAGASSINPFTMKKKK